MGEADWASREQTMIGLLMRRYQVGREANARCSSLRLRMLVVLILLLDGRTKAERQPVPFFLKQLSGANKA
jgi:hypothetical protein